MSDNRRESYRNRGSSRGPSIAVLFDPNKTDVELLDKLAEEQADKMPGEREAINSNQLRKFFGEIKELYRQFQARVVTLTEEQSTEVYKKEIEPRFKMIRSKVAYAKRASRQAKIPQEFSDLLNEGIKKCHQGNYKHFVKFVMHLEAVVGFMYGKKKVSK